MADTQPVPPVISWVGDIPIRTYASSQPLAPAVLFFHGLRVSGETHDREARSLASAGLTVVAVDAPHHGLRRSVVLDTMPDALTLEGHRVLLRILRAARDEVPRLVDHLLLAGHPKVAVAGISMGGFIALAAATAEPRLAAIASVFGSPDWTPRDGTIPPNLREAVLESPHLHPEAFPPRPLLLLNGGADDNVRPGPARELAAKLRPLYAMMGGTLVHHEAEGVDHFPSDAVWTELWSKAVRFLHDALV